MPKQLLPHRHRQHRHPILRTLALPNSDLQPLEIDVLDPELQRLAQPKARPVQKPRDKPDLTGKLAQHERDFSARENDRQPRRTARPNHGWNVPNPDVEHRPVQKQQSTERLVLRRRTHMTPDRQMAQEMADFASARFSRMRLPLEKDERLIHPTYASSVRRL
jgi:hypothetical protein